MSKAARSGISVNPADVPVIRAMIGRGDRKHDIAAWFGLNQGRIAEVEDENHGTPLAAVVGDLPPEGSPGPRATVLRSALKIIQRALVDGDVKVAETLIGKAMEDFDKPA